jgi:hypothetical protein
MSDKHLLIVGIDNPMRARRGEPRTRGLVIGTFPNWSEAIAGWEYADALRPLEGANWFAVRSADDPQWANAPHARGSFGGHGSEPRSTEEALWRVGRRAENEGRAYRNKKVGSEALAVIKGNPEVSFRKLEQILDGSLKVAGVPASGFDVTDALKRRIAIGRCKHGCDRAYWWPKSQGTLNQRCPHCNGSLYQTTLSLRRHFHRLMPVREEVSA